MIYLKENTTGRAIPLEEYIFPKGKDKHKKNLFKKHREFPRFLYKICKFKGTKDICVDTTNVRHYVDLIPCPKCHLRIKQLETDKIRLFKEKIYTQHVKVLSPVENMTDKAAELEYEVGKNMNQFNGKIKCKQCGSYLDLGGLVRWMIRYEINEIINKKKNKPLVDIEKNEELEMLNRLLSRGELRKMQRQEQIKAEKEAEEDEDAEELENLEEDITDDEFNITDEGGIK